MLATSKAHANPCCASSRARIVTTRNCHRVERVKKISIYHTRRVRNDEKKKKKKKKELRKHTNRLKRITAKEQGDSIAGESIVRVHLVFSLSLLYILPRASYRSRTQRRLPGSRRLPRLERCDGWWMVRRMIAILVTTRDASVRRFERALSSRIARFSK